MGLDFDLTKWHVWFAWYPVLVDREHGKFDMVYWKVVERRLVSKVSFGMPYTFWEYREEK